MRRRSKQAFSSSPKPGKNGGGGEGGGGGRVKGTQAWDNFTFFFDLNQILICPSQIFEKLFASFPSIFARILMFEYFRGV